MTNLNKPVKRVTAGLVKDGPKTRPVIVIMRPPKKVKEWKNESD